MQRTTLLSSLALSLSLACLPPFADLPLCFPVSISLSLFSSFPPLSSRPSLSCSSLFQQPPVMPAALLPLPLQPPEYNTASAIGLSLVTFFFLSSLTSESRARAADYLTLGRMLRTLTQF